MFYCCQEKKERERSSSMPHPGREPAGALLFEQEIEEKKKER